MSGKKKSVKKMIIALLLIVDGIILMNVFFFHYSYELLNSHDKQLMSIARVVDLNIKGMIENYRGDLSFLLNKSEYIEAEKLWKETGNATELQNKLRDTFMMADRRSENILVSEDGEVRVFAISNKQYRKVDGAGTETVQFYTDEAGTYYVAISVSRDNTSYSVLVNALEFYYRIQGAAEMEESWLMLSDYNGKVVMFPQKEYLAIGGVDAVSSATRGKEGVEKFLGGVERDLEVSSCSYEYIDEHDDKGHEARMLWVKADESENGHIAIGVVHNIEHVVQPIVMGVISIILCGVMVAEGIYILCRLIYRYKKDKEENKKELQELRRKIEMMEELNAKTEKLLHHQRLETIGTMSSGIVHEFNNLLTPIMSYSILAMEKLPLEEEEIYEDIVEIYNASVKAKRLITRMSELSAKNKESVFQKINLNDVLQKVQNIVKPVIPNNIQFQIEVLSSNLSVWGEETQLSQMFLNLILNAFQATEKDGGNVSVVVTKNEGKVMIRVMDDGIGMTEDVKEKLFEPFYTTKGPGKGTGLGLAIVQQVVEDHKGSIFVDAKRGKGSLFVIELPLCEEES